MCGIMGYVGNKPQALPVLIEGLKALEYRGYDSAGLAIWHNGTVQEYKAVGPVHQLECSLPAGLESTIGIAHTRWATHGTPSTRNCHPHHDCTQRVYVVHNGIVENYGALQKNLAAHGHTFTSETDTEVICHLIEQLLAEGFSFREAIINALKAIKGPYALLIMDAQNPHMLYGSRNSSPLIIGLGKEATLIASDTSALVGKAREVAYLRDGEIAQISATALQVFNLSNYPTALAIQNLEGDLERAQKGNFPHFMKKEIFEGPEAVTAALCGRLFAKSNTIKLGGLEQLPFTAILPSLERLILLGCGTSYYAGLVGEYLLEEIAGIPAEVHFASEFRYRKQPFSPHTMAIGISQSGETADTLAALQAAKRKGLPTFGIVNVVGSSIARLTDQGAYLHAGPEIGVASTKAFLSQVTVLALIAGYLAHERQQLLTELEKIPGKIRQILHQSSQLQKLAQKCLRYKNFMFLGRRYNYPVALEGALKLKEISYLHAEGYCAGEVKHGPLALIDENFPAIAIATRNDISDKMYSNLQEVKARGGPIIAIATEGDTSITALTDDVVYIPETIEPLEPLLTVVPLHLFAYFMGTGLGFNVDRPRNLAKSVTVE